jgi:hypothetical protein
MFLPFHSMVIKLVCAQVDGTSHFIALPGGGWKPNGATALKRRLLRRAGLRVVAVPYWEWDECRGCREQEAYLRRLLRECICKQRGACMFGRFSLSFGWLLLKA